MPRKDPRVDAYVAAAAPFARAILRHLRAVVHGACPTVIETMKWGFPHFEHEGLLCSMAAFKAHAAFGFWKHALVLGAAARPGAMGGFGRLETLEDLPPKATLARYVRKAARLNEAGVKVREHEALRRRPVRVPRALAAALAKHPQAQATFAGFSASHRREYCTWISEAKREATRARRVETAVQWLARGKSRHGKYATRGLGRAPEAGAAAGQAPSPPRG